MTRLIVFHHSAIQAEGTVEAVYEYKGSPCRT